MSEFGRMLRSLREAAGLSQPQLAKQVYISQSSLCRYEKGKQTPNSSTAVRLDELLNASGQLRILATGNSAPDVLNSDDRDRLARTIEHPHRLDERSVTALADVLAAQRRLDDALPPRLLIPATTAQLDTVTTLVRHAAGPYRAALAEVAAEYVQFAGWLHAEIRNDATALQLLTEAERAADEIDNGVLAAQAVNFKGFLARQQKRWQGVVRWFLAEHHTPGASVHQRIGAAAQAAHGAGEMGDRDGALRLLETAETLLDTSGDEPAPRTAYWLSPTFHKLNLGLAHLALKQHDVAADHISSALDSLPLDQQRADWTTEFRAALETTQKSQ
ncbi:helix-turn-helix domain-containing protein [Saccharopolyspora spinosa]|uniref:Helix-turn-helix protein n=1 Tax=Saccharopolyspora spinosa TaxID=60894 RepID=A0A2N3Y7R9_SACSN|nr:helix-turn-helix transcriptional regulator [Saccharopolyspora spinosa]PKW18984.1 helix-turn-helix protein [Saccharopolyspora spinosa]